MLQKVVEHFPEDLLDPIYIFCRDNFKHLSTNKNGLPIIKKALVKFQKGKAPFIKTIEGMTTFLGNFNQKIILFSPKSFWKLLITSSH